MRNIPKTDIIFLEELAKKAGWTFQAKDSILEKFIKTRPKDVDLSDDEIMEEVRKVRYGKV